MNHDNETIKREDPKSYIELSEKTRRVISDALEHAEIVLPEANPESWQGKEWSKWTDDDKRDFIREFLLTDDKRIVAENFSEFIEGRGNIPDGFPKKLADEDYEFLTTIMVAGMDVYGNGLVELDTLDRNIPDIMSQLQIEATEDNTEYVKQALRVVPFVGNTTGNSTVAGNRVFEHTVQFAQYLSRIEQIEDPNKRCEALLLVSSIIKSELIPDHEERLILEGISGTHPWIIMSRGRVGQSTEAGRTVLVAAKHMSLGRSVGGDTAEEREASESRNITQIPVRMEDGEILPFESYKRMHIDLMIKEMAEVMNESAEDAFFSHSFVVPGKGGIIYEGMEEFIGKLTPAGLREMGKEWLSQDQINILDKFETRYNPPEGSEKTARYELVIDCAQGRWLSAKEVLKILEDNGIEGWYMSTTSKCADGVPFGGLTIGTEGATDRVEDDILNHDIYDPTLLAEYFGTGYLPKRIETALRARLELENLASLIKSASPLQPGEELRIALAKDDPLLETYKEQLDISDETGEVNIGKLSLDKIAKLTAAQSYSLDKGIPVTFVEDEAEGTPIGAELSEKVALQTRLGGAISTYREIMDPKNREIYSDAAKYLTESVEKYLELNGLNYSEGTLRNYGMVDLQKTGEDTGLLQSSILSFHLKHPDGKDFSPNEITQLRFLARMGVDVDTEGNITHGNYPIQLGNYFAEKTVGRINEETGAVETIHADKGHPAFARIGMGSMLLKEVATLRYDIATSLPDSDEYAQAEKRLEITTRLFVENMARTVRIAQNWEMLSKNYYPEESS